MVYQIHPKYFSCHMHQPLSTLDLQHDYICKSFCVAGPRKQFQYQHAATVEFKVASSACTPVRICTRRRCTKSNGEREPHKKLPRGNKWPPKLFSEPRTPEKLHHKLKAQGPKNLTLSANKGLCTKSQPKTNKIMSLKNK